MDQTELKQTPLWQVHHDTPSKLVEFAGWSMPIQYEGIVNEAAAVRGNAGMFDVSHMGRVMFDGRDAAKFLDYLLGANVARLKEGGGKYTLLCTAEGRIIDDCIVYNMGAEGFMLVINAARMKPDMDWINAKAQSAEVAIKDVTQDVAMVAVQGPQAVRIVDAMSGGAAGSIPRFSAATVELAGIKTLTARTGYTGEDGFELMPASRDAAKLWGELVRQGVTPCGLGARDVLRLEAGYMLYGNDITTDNHPYEAGLGWTISLKKEADYIAKAALVDLKAQGLQRKICGMKMTEGGVPRAGMKVLDESGSKQVGSVTSGTFSPTLGYGIAMGYLSIEEIEAGNQLLVDVRGKMRPAEVVKLPFYRAGE